MTPIMLTGFAVVIAAAAWLADVVRQRLRRDATVIDLDEARRQRDLKRIVVGRP